MNPRLTKNAEQVSTITISALASLLLFVRATHAGGIRRDEANSVQVAVLPTLPDIWKTDFCS